MAIEKSSSQEKLPELGAKLLWVDNPQQVSRVIKCLAGLCVVLFLLDFVIHRHAYFSYEKWPGFYAVAGFVSFTLIVLAAKNLRRLIGRDESYYKPYAVDAEDYPQEGLGLAEHNQSGSDDDETAAQRYRNLSDEESSP